MQCDVHINMQHTSFNFNFERRNLNTIQKALTLGRPSNFKAPNEV